MVVVGVKFGSGGGGGEVPNLVIFSIFSGLFLIVPWILKKFQIATFSPLY